MLFYLYFQFQFFSWFIIDTCIMHLTCVHVVHTAKSNKNKCQLSRISNTVWLVIFGGGGNIHKPPQNSWETPPSNEEKSIQWSLWHFGSAAIVLYLEGVLWWEVHMCTCTVSTIAFINQCHGQCPLYRGCPLKEAPLYIHVMWHLRLI